MKNTDKGLEETIKIMNRVVDTLVKDRTSAELLKEFLKSSLTLAFNKGKISMIVPEGRRVCIICKEEKDLENDFHKHPTNRDGRDYRCKVCARAIHRVKNNKKYTTEMGRASFLRRQQRGVVYRDKLTMLAKYPEKTIARDIYRKAVMSGKLLRMPCEVCGNVKSEGHHADYSKPLEVIWLCRQHHAQIDKKDNSQVSGFLSTIKKGERQSRRHGLNIKSLEK